MSDWSQPTNISLYTEVLDEIHELMNKNATMLRDSVLDLDTNLPVDSVRWDTTSNMWTKWNGTVWDPLSIEYDINVLNLGGEVAAYYLDFNNFTGTLPLGAVDNTNHGDLTTETLHALATDTTAGFMSAQDKLDLVAAANPDQATFDASVKTTLDTGVNSILFSANFANADNELVIDVANGSYQTVTYTAATTIGFASTGTKPFSMKLFINTGGFIITLPLGLWEGGIVESIAEGYCLVDIIYDGTNYIYDVKSNLL